MVGSWNILIATPYIEQFNRQSNEITNNQLRAVGINNQLAINAPDLMRNLKVSSRAADAVTEFSNSIAKTCAYFFAAQQQQ